MAGRSSGSSRLGGGHHPAPPAAVLADLEVLARGQRTACRSSYTGPTNLDGCAKAGSSALTRVRLTRQATWRPGTAFCKAWTSQ